MHFLELECVCIASFYIWFSGGWTIRRVCVCVCIVCICVFVVLSTDISLVLHCISWLHSICMHLWLMCLSFWYVFFGLSLAFYIQRRSMCVSSSFSRILRVHIVVIFVGCARSMNARIRTLHFLDDAFNGWNASMCVALPNQQYYIFTWLLQYMLFTATLFSLWPLSGAHSFGWPISCLSHLIRISSSAT